MDDDAVDALARTLGQEAGQGLQMSRYMGRRPPTHTRPPPDVVVMMHTDVQEHLAQAAENLKVNLIQLVPFHSNDIILECNGIRLPKPIPSNMLVCEGFLKGKKGAKAAAVAERMADDGVFACDPEEGVAQAENWLKAIYEMETGEEL